MHEAELYSKLPDDAEKTKNRVQCGLCAHRCIIKNGSDGICGVRFNRGGKLFTSSYGRVCVEAVDPIEKKPLYHFLPGTKVYSLGDIGCNFKCRHCQNWEISQCTVSDSIYSISPQKAVYNAVDAGCKSIAFTYNEPALRHEYVRELCPLAHDAGLKTIYVTNGYLTKEAVSDLKGYIDAFRVDIKAFSDDFYKKICGGRLQPVLDSAKHAKECGMHIEVVNLIIPTLNDSDDMLKSLSMWIYDNLGADTPLHFTAFHPDYNLTEIDSTPISTLDRACNIAKSVGLNYVYIGNVQSHPMINTYCHNCGEVLIARNGYRQKNLGLNGNICKKCGAKIPIVVE